jgi:hypothetical protein
MKVVILQLAEADLKSLKHYGTGNFGHEQDHL